MKKIKPNFGEVDKVIIEVDLDDLKNCGWEYAKKWLEEVRQEKHMWANAFHNLEKDHFTRKDMKDFAEWCRNGLTNVEYSTERLDPRPRGYDDLLTLVNQIENSKLSELIAFACYLTGHDEETIRQMYNDWKKKEMKVPETVINNRDLFR